MSNAESVTEWIEGLKRGDASAVDHLWQRFYQRLVHLAAKKLRDSPRRVADEEDFVLSAFNTFARLACEGRFPELRDRDGLWLLLVKITERRILHWIRDQSVLKRGGGKVRGESAIRPFDTTDGNAGLDRFAGKEPTPEFVAEMTEDVDRRLSELSPALRDVAILKMGGYSNKEIAGRLACSPPTVERRLHVIRKIWSDPGPGDAANV